MNNDEQKTSRLRINSAIENFKTSSFSNGTNCVAVARFKDGSVKIRNSKDPSGQTFSFANSEWMTFVQGVKNREFDVA